MRKLALSRSSTPITVMSCVVLVAMGVVSDTTANLGESLSVAEARSHEYGTKYKAIARLSKPTVKELLCRNVGTLQEEIGTSKKR